MVKPTKEDLKNRSFDVPPSVRKAAKKGLELRRKHGRGGLSVKEASKMGINSGVTTAKALMTGKVSYDIIERMNRYFPRHASHADAKGDPSRGFWGDDDNPSAGYVANLIWGSDAGKRWVSSIFQGLN
jgi:hypothetical protein